jgi:hypothetical protein
MPLGVVWNDRLLVFWATSPDTSRYGAFHLDTLWGATFQRNRWSTPRVIWASGELTWLPGMASLGFHDGAPILAFPARVGQRSGNHGVVVVTRSGTGWHSRWIETGGLGPHAVHAASLGSGELLIAATGSVNRAHIAADRATYAIRLSTKDTSRAPQFTLIGRSGQLSPAEPRLLPTASELRVIWRNTTRTQDVPDSLMESSSTDDGASWTPPRATSLGFRTPGMRVIAQQNGDAMAFALDTKSYRITTFRRTTHGWLPDSTASFASKTLPSIAIADGRLIVALGHAVRSAGPDSAYSAPVLHITTRSLTCRSGSRHVSRADFSPPSGASHPSTRTAYDPIARDLGHDRPAAVRRRRLQRFRGLAH